LYDAEHSKITLKDLFAQDPQRFSKFSKEYNSTSGPDVTMLVDLSKNLITESVLETLLSLASEAGVKEYIPASTSTPPRIALFSTLLCATLTTSRSPGVA